MPDPRSPRPAAPTDAVRAAVTAGLGLYFFGLLLTVLGNSSSGASALVRTLEGRLFAPWMVPAWLDLGFDHHLTHGLPEDADHALEIRAADGATVRLPGAAWGERAARWRRLARAMAVGGAGDPAVLAAAVGRGAFAACGSEDVVVRVLRRPLPERDAPAAEAAPQGAYSARVRLAAGELQLIPLEARAELAPLVRPGGAAP